MIVTVNHGGIMTMEEQEILSRNVMADAEERKFHIQLRDLYAGWLGADFILDGEKVLLCADEAFDWVIDLVEVYISVRDYGKGNVDFVWDGDHASWYWNEDAEVHLDVYHLEKDFFRLHMHVKFYDGKPEIFEKTVDLTKDELLGGLDDFFKQILKNPGFPVQYPAGCMDYTEESEEKASMLLDELMDFLPRECYAEDKDFIRLSAICDKAVKVPAEETKRFIDDYREMLETHELSSRFLW